MRETVTLAAGRLRAEVVPSVGGGLARFDRVDATRVLPVLRPWPEGGSGDPNRLASYPLVPWSNRISGGGFAFGGKFHALAANMAGEPCPIHGNGWTSPWQVEVADRTSVSLALASDGPGPYRYAATLAYRLDPEGLVMTLSVTNRAERTLPHGLGFHPWLPRTAATRLTAPATGVWLEGPGHLPSGTAPVALPEAWDFSAPRPLPAGWVNNGFAGWTGRARVEWPDRGLAIAITASSALSTYILYSPDETADFFCFEPVSHPVDAHNLPGGPTGNGLVLLPPGARLAVDCRIDVEAA